MLTFDEIAKKIINNKKYIKMKNESHHGVSRYDHSLRVAGMTYKISKLLKQDYVSATRAALLHDFFINEDFHFENSFDKTKNHAGVALKNSETHFHLNNLEKDAIITHMFPLNLKMPSTKEGITISLIDKTVAVYECTRFKLNTAITIWFLFIFNLITFTNN